MNKYNADDAWDEIEDYYGDDLETKDQEFVNDVMADFSIDGLSYGANDPAEYVDSFRLNLVDQYGKDHEVEMVGRIDVDGRTYLLVHLTDDPDPSSLSPLIAWDDENGQMHVCNIEDEAEYKRVAEYVDKLLTDDPEAEDIPGGGVQWND